MFSNELKQKVEKTSKRACHVGFVTQLELMFVLIIFMLGHVAHAEPAISESKLPEMLLQAIGSAMRSHPDVLKAESEMQSAKSQVKAGEFRWFPVAEVGMRAGENGDRYSTIGINQPLWDGGKRNADFEVAKAGESVAFAGKYTSMQSLGMAAADAYLGLARAREQLLVAESNVNEHQKLSANVVKRNLGGVGSKSDASLATSRLQQAKAVEKQVQGEVAKAEAIYFSVIGAKPAEGAMQEVALWDFVGGKDALISKVLSRSYASNFA